VVGRIKENDRWDEFSYGVLTYCKNFCKCHNTSPLSTTIKKVKNMVKDRIRAINK
jgi:hypothetical protein